jgi:hypothetical protein
MDVTLEKTLVDLLTQALTEKPTNNVSANGTRKYQPWERYPIARSQVDLVVEPVFDRKKRRESFEFTALSREESGLLSSADVLGLLELLRVVASGYSEMPGESDMTRVVMDWLEKGIFDLQVNVQKMHGMAKRGIVLPRRAA